MIPAEASGARCSAADSPAAPPPTMATRIFVLPIAVFPDAESLSDAPDEKFLNEVESADRSGLHPLLRLRSARRARGHKVGAGLEYIADPTLT